MTTRKKIDGDLVPAQTVPREDEVRAEILARLSASGKPGDRTLAERLQTDEHGAALLRRAVLVLLVAQAEFTLYSEHRLYRPPPDEFDREFLHEMVLMAVLGMLRSETDVRRAPAAKGGGAKKGHTKYGADVRDYAVAIYLNQTTHLKRQSERLNVTRRLLVEGDAKAGIKRPLPPPSTIRSWVEAEKNATGRK
ncbi:hypothetical protein J5Y09_18220 [Roseomonas sp. PWR1]|uniref:Uncharacterized protein n=1 Tax=Roseomonas nitratireducens TaxID=2820810 RepID=A0ABS4AYH9_9PROT|nr:hypothetical protein [Neoroseomonas nitratireducens]MBP0465868.1 hypothetical protein [Neoroseomonas nitratireducens]